MASFLFLVPPGESSTAPPAGVSCCRAPWRRGRGGLSAVPFLLHPASWLPPHLSPFLQNPLLTESTQSVKWGPFPFRVKHNVIPSHSHAGSGHAAPGGAHHLLGRSGSLHTRPPPDQTQAVGGVNSFPCSVRAVLLEPGLAGSRAGLHLC